MNEYCECSYPGSDSVSAYNNTCATCGKTVRIYNEDTADPSNDTAMNELFNYIEGWARRHGFESWKEIKYVSQYLAGRINAVAKVEDLKKKWGTQDEPGH